MLHRPFWQSIFFSLILHKEMVKMSLLKESIIYGLYFKHSLVTDFHHKDAQPGVSAFCREWRLLVHFLMCASKGYIVAASTLCCLFFHSVSCLLLNPAPQSISINFPHFRPKFVFSARFIWKIKY